MINYFIKSGYSFFKSILSIDSIISFAKKENLKQIALIDEEIMYGTYDFIKKAKANNIIPIIGIHFPGQKKIIVAKNYEGYKELMKLSSFPKNIDIEIKRLKETNLFIFSDENINFSTYLSNDDLNTFKLFKSINNEEVTKKDIVLNLSENNFLLSEEQLNILKTLNNFSFSFDEEKQTYKKTLEFNKEADLVLKEKLEVKFNEFIKINKNIDIDIYKKRLEYEFRIIKQMNFSNYFLIVEDYVNFAKAKKILLGPGRGSASGSFISFLLGITLIDPIKNGLIFERFLNPSRVTIPDIDIDFQDDRREEVIDYISEKYSKTHVSQIITFSTFQMKSTIKDFARIYDIPFAKVNSFTKLLTDRKTLEQNLKTKKVKEFLQENEIFNEIILHTKKIINLPRQISTHAAGLVIANQPIHEIVPVLNNHHSNIQLTQYSMNFLEENGLIKFDLLGLKTLSTLKRISQLVLKTQNKELKLEVNDLDDKKVFELLSSGKTQGIFQLESNGMIEVLKKVKINSFEDIVAVISLYRPGPMKNIDEFSKRKNDPEFKISFDPDVDEILKKTYGIIVYQEQILEIVKAYSNFDYVTADNLRRAISKKDLQKIEKMKELFFEGALKNGKDIKNTKIIYDFILEFSNYGFNRSHAYAYSILTYNFAWLKCYFPNEFAAAYLTNVDKNIVKIKSFLEENPSIKLKLPSINYSFKKLSFEKDQTLRLGFNAIKGFGIEVINKINIAKKNNENKVYENIYESFFYLKNAGLTNNNIEDLIKVGAFDEYGFSREELLLSYEDIIKLTNLVTTVTNKIDLSLIKKEDLPLISTSKNDINNKNYEEKLLGIIITK